MQGMPAICGFSALQRAENSSIRRNSSHKPLDTRFQCSSASRKFLNGGAHRCAHRNGVGFSALQRAENSSIIRIDSAHKPLLGVSVLFSEPKIPQCNVCVEEPQKRLKFQCSSASRKFLNRPERESNNHERHVSVLFSEPKIPQSTTSSDRLRLKALVSVLFSEPKIPQL